MTHDDIWKALAIEDSFLERHAETIRTRLLSAGEAILEGRRRSASQGGARFFLHPADISAINQCLHLASVASLLWTNPKRLQDVVTSIQQEKLTLGDLDPTTIVTSVVLFHLLVREMADRPDLAPKTKKDQIEGPDTSAEPKGKLGSESPEPTREDKLKAIWDRFKNLNWMISNNAVKSLDLPSD